MPLPSFPAYCIRCRHPLHPCILLVGCMALERFNTINIHALLAAAAALNVPPHQLATFASGWVLWRSQAYASRKSSNTYFEPSLQDHTGARGSRPYAVIKHTFNHPAGSRTSKRQQAHTRPCPPAHAVLPSTLFDTASFATSDGTSLRAMSCKPSGRSALKEPRIVR